jgi:two-component system cell cycle response regulator
MKVLIADDDPVSRRMLQAFLEKWSYKVVVAENGAHAWELFGREDAPRLAILDWMMPGMTGVEVCQQVRARPGRPYVYILLLTARGLKEDLLEGMNAGADDYLSKPFDPKELKARLQVGGRIVELQDELIAAREALRFQATHDPLTGACNRAEILVALRRELARNQREGGSVGVILLDLDHFKRINDTWGHLAGDAVLQEAVKRINACVRPYDVIGRYGGEEFLIVVPATDAMGALGEAERIRACLAEKAFETPGGSIAVTASFGVCAAGQSSYAKDKKLIDPKILLAASDAALYRAKEQGRNRVEIAAPSDLAAAITPELAAAPNELQQEHQK